MRKLLALCIATFTALPAYAGDVFGPPSAVNLSVMLANGTSGKLIKTSPLTCSPSGVVAGLTSLPDLTTIAGWTVQNLSTAGTPTFSSVSAGTGTFTTVFGTVNTSSQPNITTMANLGFIQGQLFTLSGPVNVGASGLIVSSGAGTLNQSVAFGASPTFGTVTATNLDGVITAVSQPNITTLAGVLSIGASSATALTGTLQTPTQNIVTTMPNLTSVQGQTVTLAGALNVSSGAGTLNQSVASGSSPTFGALATGDITSTNSGSGTTTFQSVGNQTLTIAADTANSGNRFATIELRSDGGSLGSRFRYSDSGTTLFIADSGLASLVSVGNNASTFRFNHFDATTTPMAEFRQSNSGGDASVAFVQNGTHSYTIGVSPSDNRFALAHNASGSPVLGTSTMLSVDTSGNAYFTGSITTNSANSVRFADSDSSNYVGFKSSATVLSNTTWTLPAADSTGTQALVSDGAGNLSWATISGGGTPGGATTQVQFNDSGAFGGDAGMTYNKTTDALTLVGSITASNVNQSVATGATPSFGGVTTTSTTAFLASNATTNNFLANTTSSTINLFTNVDTGTFNIGTNFTSGVMQIGNATGSSTLLLGGGPGSGLVTVGSSTRSVSMPGALSVTGSITGTLAAGAQNSITTLNGATSVGLNSSTTLTGTLQTAAQANVTSVGTLTSLDVASSTTTGNAASVVANSLTSGKALRVLSTSTDTTARSLVDVQFTGATNTSNVQNTLSLQHSGTGAGATVLRLTGGAANGTPFIWDAYDSASTRISTLDDAGSATFLGGLAVGTTTEATGGNATFANDLSITKDLVVAGGAGPSGIYFTSLPSNAAGSPLCIVGGGGSPKVNVVTYVSAGTCAPSLRKLKDNIVSSTLSVDDIYKLRPVEFTWNSGILVGKRDFGLIAEEVAELFPLLATRNVETGALMGVQYDKIGVLAISALQKLRNVVDGAMNQIASLWSAHDEHETRIIELESQLATMHARLEALENR